MTIPPWSVVPFASFGQRSYNLSRGFSSVAPSWKFRQDDSLPSKNLSWANWNLEASHGIIIKLSKCLPKMPLLSSLENEA